jgi:hypothetical protein
MRWWRRHTGWQNVFGAQGTGWTSVFGAQGSIAEGCGWAWTSWELVWCLHNEIAAVGARLQVLPSDIQWQAPHKLGRGWPAAEGAAGTHAPPLQVRPPEVHCKLLMARG